MGNVRHYAEVIEFYDSIYMKLEDYKLFSFVSQTHLTTRSMHIIDHFIYNRCYKWKQIQIQIHTFIPAFLYNNLQNILIHFWCWLKKKKKKKTICLIVQFHLKMLWMAIRPIQIDTHFEYNLTWLNGREEKNTLKLHRLCSFILHLMHRRKKHSKLLCRGSNESIGLHAIIK